MCSTSIKIALLLNPGRRARLDATKGRYPHRVLKRKTRPPRPRVTRATVRRPQRRLTSLVFETETPRGSNGTGHQSAKSRIADHRHQPSFELSERARTHTHTNTIAQIVIGYCTRTRQSVT